jgi:hypothetical protein
MGAGPSFGQSLFPTKVILDRATFSPSDYPVMQQLADVVNKTVDQLIPGFASDLPQGIILCYQVPQSVHYFDTTDPPPITLSDSKLHAYEPNSVRAGQVRIALRYVDNHPQQFAFQLAHELAHVKMGVHLDNYLIETLAVAVSYEVLIRMQWATYVKEEIDIDIAALPEPLQIAFKNQDFGALRSFWQQRSPHEGICLSDRSFQTVGAILIRRQQVPWAHLLGTSPRKS